MTREAAPASGAASEDIKIRSARAAARRVPMRPPRLGFLETVRRRRKMGSGEGEIFSVTIEFLVIGPTVGVWSLAWY